MIPIRTNTIYDLYPTTISIYMDDAISPCTMIMTARRSSVQVSHSALIPVQILGGLLSTSTSNVTSTLSCRATAFGTAREIGNDFGMLFGMMVGE